MVGNALTRRRHVIASPAVCIAPLPPGVIPPYVGCDCRIGAAYAPPALQIEVMLYATLATIDAGLPVTINVHSEPELAWDNPYTAPNGGSSGPHTLAIPADCMSVAIVALFDFPNGHHCHAYFIRDTEHPPT